MFVALLPSAPAFTVSPFYFSNLLFAIPDEQMSSVAQSCLLPSVPPSGLPNLPREQVRHLLFGSLGAVQGTITDLHARGYAEPNDWSRPISTGRPNEVMSILTKRISMA